MAGVELHSWGMKIYGCPSDNYISIFGCPATFLVVPGAQTTKILNARYGSLAIMSKEIFKILHAIVTI